MPKYTLTFQKSDPVWRPKKSPEPHTFEAESDESAIATVAKITGFNTFKPGKEAIDYDQFFKAGGDAIVREDGEQVYP